MNYLTVYVGLKSTHSSAGSSALDLTRLQSRFHPGLGYHLRLIQGAICFPTGLVVGNIQFLAAVGFIAACGFKVYRRRERLR